MGLLAEEENMFFDCSESLPYQNNTGPQRDKEHLPFLKEK